MKMRFWLLFTFLVNFYFNSPCYALKPETHRVINEYVAQASLDGFSLGLYLRNQLGIEDGVSHSFNSKEVWESIGDGGENEDEPFTRSANHFHNPLTKQGFTGIWGTGFLSGVSSVLWSQQPKEAQTPGGYYSWVDARKYFYKALTDSDKTAREENFAETFRGLGQLMHLLQDLSVPEHARDDGHYTFYNYEEWAKTAVTKLSVPSFTPNFFDSTALGNVNLFAPVPVANLFDNNRYTAATTPDITMDSNIGLSEYTNANFISPDTMFSSAFPHPSLASVVEYEDSTNGKKRTYLKKLGQGETEGEKIGYGEHINHLALAGRLYKLLPPDLKKNALMPVYTDYAEKLIPRAIGYSAGLLKYFFRGKMEMIPDEAASSGYVIVNRTDEDMSGKFNLYYDNNSDQRVSINQDSWTFAIGRKSSGNNKSMNLSFNPPTDAKEPGKYILVFRGILGNEADAVIASLINEVYPAYYAIKEGEPYYIIASWSDLEPIKAYKASDVTILEPWTNMSQVDNYANLKMTGEFFNSGNASSTWQMQFTGPDGTNDSAALLQLDCSKWDQWGEGQRDQYMAFTTADAFTPHIHLMRPPTSDDPNSYPHNAYFASQSGSNAILIEHRIEGYTPYFTLRNTNYRSTSTIYVNGEVMEQEESSYITRLTDGNIQITTLGESTNNFQYADIGIYKGYAGQLAPKKERDAIVYATPMYRQTGAYPSFDFVEVRYGCVRSGQSARRQYKEEDKILGFDVNHKHPRLCIVQLGPQT